MQAETKRPEPWVKLAEAAEVFGKATEWTEKYEMLAADLSPLFPEGTRKAYRLGEKLISVIHDDEVGLVVKEINAPSAFDLKWPEAEAKPSNGFTVYAEDDPLAAIEAVMGEPVPHAEPVARSLPDEDETEPDDGAGRVIAAEAVTDGEDDGFPAPQTAEAAEFGPLRGSLVVGGQIRDLDETA